MSRIMTASTKNFEKANPRDLIQFFAMLDGESQFKKAEHIFVNSYTEAKHKTAPDTMTQISINFQIFEKGDKHGQSWTWNGSRAKSFACGQYCFTQNK